MQRKSCLEKLEKNNAVNAGELIEEKDVKIGTPEEAAWTQIKKQAETERDQMKRSLIISDEIIILAEKMIKKES
jgi:hypothetical protein